MRSLKLRVPEHVHLLFLPPYSPELQPAEHLWPLTNTALANRHFATIDDLEDAQAERCVALQARPDLIRSATLFHWWPQRIKKRQGPRRNYDIPRTLVARCAIEMARAEREAKAEAVPIPSVRKRWERESGHRPSGRWPLWRVSARLNAQTPRRLDPRLSDRH